VPVGALTVAILVVNNLRDIETDRQTGKRTLAVADGVFSPLPALAAMAGALLIQIGTNLANDYFDYVKGVDVAERKGPTRVAQSGLVSLTQLRLGIVVTFALAALAGLYLVMVGGWPILAIGVASLISALAYTGGPFPIGYHAAVIAAVPVGALTVAILVVNNLRDIETDRQTGKRTLAVMIGPRGTRLEYVVLLAVAYAVPVLFWLAEWASAWVMLPWLTVPLALRLVRTLHQTTEGRSLNKALAGTANLDLAFGLLFALGLVL
jgi:1,4-dihydroxy-2-naphthoate octaprenyltransferase